MSILMLNEAVEIVDRGMVYVGFNALRYKMYIKLNQDRKQTLIRFKKIRRHQMNCWFESILYYQL